MWPFGKKRDAEMMESTMDRLVNVACEREAFALLYAKLLGERMDGVEVSFLDEMTLRLRNSDGREVAAHLGNVWSLYRRQGTGRRELLEQQVRVTQALFEAKAPAERDRIVAMIKDAGYLEQASARVELVTDHLVADLWMVYAEDLPDRTSTITEAALGPMGVTRQELRALAIGNLRRILPEVERHGDGPWVMVTAADYTASLLLLDEVWEEFAGEVDGEVVVTVPARDVLLVTGSENGAGLSGMRRRAASLVETGDHVISETLLVRRGGVWAVFDAQ